MAKKYDESTVQTLDALAHIRLRSGMYIGRLGDGSHPDDGIYVMLKEVIDNCVDEFIMHHGTKIEIELDEKTSKVSVRDYGRGIPLGKVIECVSQINTGAKYNDDVFQFSVGLNGVGTKAVNALSSHFIVRSYPRWGVCRSPLCQEAFSKIKRRERPKSPTAPMSNLFPIPRSSRNSLSKKRCIIKRLWHYAYLNTGLTLLFNGETICSENGLLDLLNDEVKEDRLYEPLHYRGKTCRVCLSPHL